MDALAPTPVAPLRGRAWGFMPLRGRAWGFVG